MSDEAGLIDEDDPEDRKTREEQDERDEQRADLLRQRLYHYGRVFSAGDTTADDVQFVMQDLSKFCSAFKSTFSPDPRVSSQLDGRREVFLRIMDNTQLDVPTLFRKYHEGT